MKMISVFSGCGAMDKGFQEVGFQSILSVDNNLASYNSLIANKSSDKIICDNIENINFRTFKGKADIVIGGPPCQPYSQTRHYLVDKPRGFEDLKSGNTVSEYFRVIKEVEPTFFFFENVDGFKYKTHERELQYLKKKSEDLNYNITYDVLNAADYGVPQTRKRFVCVGIKKKAPPFIFPRKTHSDPRRNEDKKLLDWVNCGDVLKEYDYITKEEMDQKPGGKDNRLLRLIPPGDNYLFFTEKRGCKNPVFKWKSRYWTFLLKLSPNRPSWTIQASFSHNQGPFHWKNRFLRIEELKRLQTIPDSYKLHGDFKQQWKQVGNAFPTLLAKIIAKEILQK